MTWRLRGRGGMAEAGGAMIYKVQRRQTCLRLHRIAAEEASPQSVSQCPKHDKLLHYISLDFHVEKEPPKSASLRNNVKVNCLRCKLGGTRCSIDKMHHGYLAEDLLGSECLRQTTERQKPNKRTNVAANRR